MFHLLLAIKPDRRPGGNPKARLNCLPRWLWSAKPVCSAISASGSDVVDSSRSVPVFDVKEQKIRLKLLDLPDRFEAVFRFSE